MGQHRVAVSKPATDITAQTTYPSPTRLFPVLIHAHHGGVEGGQRFKETFLHLTNVVRVSANVVDDVHGILHSA